MKQRVKRAIVCARREAARMARKAALWAKAKLSALWGKSKAVGLSLMVAMMTTLPAFAGGTGGDSGSGSGSGASLTTIVSATDTVTEMIGKAWDAMTGNPLLRVYVAAGLLSVGIGFFGYLKRQSRH